MFTKQISTDHDFNTVLIVYISAQDRKTLHKKSLLCKIEAVLGIASSVGKIFLGTIISRLVTSKCHLESRADFQIIFSFFSSLRWFFIPA